MNKIHPDLLTSQKLLYEPSGLSIEHLIKEAESDEYAAYEFTLDNRRIKFRAAKITPTKVGQFVTLWKRIGKGPIMPFDEADPIDYFIISVRSGELFGQFVFPKEVLISKSIVTQGDREGKRAIRVYPPWDVTDSPQAKKTQSWQSSYFIEIKPNQAESCIRKFLSI
jgi:hypothetical protein